MQKSCPVHVVWFRNDLRIQDHQALDSAIKNCQAGELVQALFIVDQAEEEWGYYQLGWLKRSLSALENSLHTLGVNLTVLYGDTFTTITHFAKTHQVQSMYWHRRYIPAQQDLDRKIKEALSQNTSCHSYPGYLCLEPWRILNKSSQPFKVFTPYWKALQGNIQTDQFYLNKQPQKVQGNFSATARANLEKIPDTWNDALITRWQPGEEMAQEKLRLFIEKLVSGYATGRDRPDLAATSELSPYLRFGEICPHRIWADVCVNEVGTTTGAQVYLSELAWRDFGYYVIHHFPYVINQAFKPAFDEMPWQQNTDQLKQWQQGQTGYPLVDAGMRQLLQIGWMHNRIRMLVASFLTKHLLMDWRLGQAWFKEYLLDHDPASNLSGWQWSAGCGVDAQPYFRIFNPTRQAEKFDPQGDYIGKYVPELKAVPAALRKEPWVDKGFMVANSIPYPQPMVDHKQARVRALEALKSIRKVDDN